MAIYKKDDELRDKIIAALKSAALNIRVKNDETGDWENLPIIDDTNYNDKKPKNTMARAYNVEELAKATLLSIKASDEDTEITESELIENMRQTYFKDAVEHIFLDDFDNSKKLNGIETIAYAISKEIVDYLLKNAEVVIENRFNDLDSDFNVLLDKLLLAKSFYNTNKNIKILATDYDAVTTAYEKSTSDIAELNYPADELDIVNKINEIVRVINDNKLKRSEGIYKAVSKLTGTIKNDINNAKFEDYNQHDITLAKIMNSTANVSLGAREQLSQDTKNTFEKLENNNGDKEKISIK